MKIALIIIICLIVIMIGRGIGHQYTVKYRFYTSLLNLLEDLKLSISFKKEKIQLVLDKHKDSKELKQLVYAYENYLNNGTVDLTNVKEIDAEDVELLMEIIQSLGRYNSSTELMQIDTYIETIKVKEFRAEEDKKKYQPMVNKLSFLLSLAIGIILL